MNFAEWVNKHWTHTRDTAVPRDFGVRALIHIPIGIYMGLFDWSNGLAYLFYKFERNEDVHTEDQAWKDIYGSIIGWVIGRSILITGILILIIWLVNKLGG
jgi:hypothetical protein